MVAFTRVTDTRGQQDNASGKESHVKEVLAFREVSLKR